MTDISGVVASVLTTYLTVLDQCAQSVQGDSQALQAQAQRHSAQAAGLDEVISEIGSAVSKSAVNWQGQAQQAFATAATALTKDLQGIDDQLKAESQRLSMTASAITTTMSAMDTVRSEFLQYAKVLVDEARMAASGSEAAFLDAAEKLGDSAVQAASTARQRLADALTQLYGLKSETPETEAKEEEGPGKVKVDFEQLKKGSLNWIDDEVLDGRKRPKSVPSWFANSGWYKLDQDGLSGTRAPLKANTPFGDAELPEDPTTGQKLWHSTDITLIKREGVLGDDSWGGKITDGTDEAHAYLGPRATWDASALVHSGEVRVDGKIEGTLADVGASGSASDGLVTVRGDVDAYVGGEANGHLDGSLHGGAIHLDAFAGGKIGAAGGVDVAGIGVGAKGELEAGIGAQLDGQATMDNGHFKVNFKVGAALGVGASVGANIDVDVPKVWENASHYGHEAYESVSNTAYQAAEAIGARW